MDQKKLKVGIVGLGNISKVYINYIQKSKNSELVAACDVSKKNLTSIKKKFKKIYVSTNIDQILNNVKIDLMIITSFSGLHYEHTKKCLNKKINTITEKPISLRVEDGIHLMHLAKKYKLSAGVSLQNRFNKAVVFANNLIKNENIGKKVTASVRIRWCRDNEYYSTKWRGTWKLDGGVIAQQAVHHIDILQMVCGKINKIYAIKNKRLNSLQAEDTCVAALEFKNGMLCTFEATTSARPYDYEASLTVLFEKGMIEIGGLALNKINNFVYKNYSKQKINRLIKNNSEDFQNPIGNGHEKIMKETVNRLLSNNKIPVVSIKESLKSLEIIHSIYSSTEMDRSINLKSKTYSQKLGK